MTRTIAHVLPFPSVGGTEHATLRIARAVEPEGLRSIAFCRGDAATVGAFFRDAGLPTASYEAPTHSYRHAGSFLRDSWRLARAFREHRVELVHCADLLAAYHAALAGWMARVPVVCHVRNRFAEISRRDASFLWPVARFVFVSRSTWDGFGYRVGASRGVVVYDGIDLPATARQAEDRVAVRRELGLDSAAPVIGMLARVAPQKDFPTLGRAAVRILEADPRVRFVVAGDCSSAEPVRRHYDQVRHELARLGVDGSFVFTGARPDVPRILAALDLFVLSTHWEGLPLSILEAMAHGLPVVATGVDGIPEIVEDGRTGLLVQRGDDQELARCCLSLLHDAARARALGDAGRERVRGTFTREAFAAAMLRVYRSMLEARAAGSAPASAGLSRSARAR